ncbi:hypothetical protein Avbf_10300 [Armadillidium vulgare]|nr:hypothetical protein Avbf_10300 [Armadillidium vulgare]
MALITDKAIVLILVIGFVQIVHLQARHTEYVFGPRQHLDSGQDFGDPSLPDFELHQETPLQNRNIRERKYLNNRDALIETFEKFLEENDDSYFYVDEDEGPNFNDFDDLDDIEKEHYDTYSENDEDYSYISQVPLKRVRRRIIPIGGGALDRGRSGRNGPYERTRSPWGQTSNRNRDGFARRSGPTGSAALFSLFPDLAPPEWKANRGEKNNSKKKKASKEKDKGSNKNKKDDLSEDEKLEEKSQKDEPSPSDSSASQKRRIQKKKTKLSKKEKEEIAKFADSHGVEKAVSHFKSRVNAPLRANAVEKFLRRYKNRMQRKANRS